MTPLVERRLSNQSLTRPFRGSAADLVAAMGAVQAQEFGPAKWGLALRLARTSQHTEIERAFSQGHILRTHVMRPTWHFVARNDIRWMLELTRARVHRAMAPYHRYYELDASTLIRGTSIFERALSDGACLTRAELRDALGRRGIEAHGTRLALLAMYAEFEGVMCSGPRRGRQFTYASLSARAPKAIRLSREESIAELTRRFLATHGPATIRDFVWWSGLSTEEVKRGVEMVSARPDHVDGITYWSSRTSTRRSSSRSTVHLLPVYDEYLVAYRDRVLVPHGSSSFRWARGSVTFQHAMLIDGHVAGTWRIDRQRTGWKVHLAPARRMNARERAAAAGEADRYQKFWQE